MTTGTILAAEPRKRAISTVVWLPLVLFCLGHFFVDLYSAALGVLQPLLLDQFRLNYTQAGILGGVLVFSSSVMQPRTRVRETSGRRRAWSAIDQRPSR